MQEKNFRNLFQPTTRRYNHQLSTRSPGFGGLSMFVCGSGPPNSAASASAGMVSLMICGCSSAGGIWLSDWPDRRRRHRRRAGPPVGRDDSEATPHTDERRRRSLASRSFSYSPATRGLDISACNKNLLQTLRCHPLEISTRLTQIYTCNTVAVTVWGRGGLLLGNPT